MTAEIKRYALAHGAGLIAAAVCIAISGIWNVESGKEIFKILCDAFLFAGVLLFSCGALIFAANGGAFDSLIFAAVKLIKTRSRRADCGQNFYDFCKEKRKTKRKFGFLLLSGFAFVLTSVVFLIAFCLYK